MNNSLEGVVSGNLSSQGMLNTGHLLATYREQFTIYMETKRFVEDYRKAGF